MKRFENVFLKERLGRRVHVAAFGKHPAWDDHLDILGVPTESLVLLEDVLYRRGITAQLAAGRWVAGPGRQGGEFNHRFVWTRRAQSLIGALWPSSDGKGRVQFPFCACVHAGCDGATGLHLYLEHVEKLGEQCRTVSRREEVKALLVRCGVELNRRPVVSSDTRPVPPLEIPRDGRRQIVAALVAVAALMVQAGAHGDLLPAAHRHLRLPVVSQICAINLSFYAGYLQQLSSASACLLFTPAAESTFVDVLVGEPDVDSWYCLKADIHSLSYSKTLPGHEDSERRTSDANAYLTASAVGRSTAPTPRRRWWPV